MQTFLPYPSFVFSAACLDNKRLGKQRVEVLQILRTLKGESKGWSNHPIVKAWEGYEAALAEYGMVVCLEWRGRGYKDTCLDKIGELAEGTVIMPTWFGDNQLHLSHQSNLVRKFPEHYRRWFGDVPDDLEYVWPV